MNDQTRLLPKWPALLFLVVFAFYLGHVSQHDLHQPGENSASECEFCLKSSGNDAVSSKVYSPDNLLPTDWLVSPPIPSIISSYTGYNYNSRAPPAN